MQAGTYDVTLIVTDGGVTDTITRHGFITTSATEELPLLEGFEAGILPPGWKLHDAGNDGTNWAVTNKAGGFGQSSNSIFFDNYDFDVQGKEDEFWTAKLDFTNIFETKAMFDVAYAVYGYPYSDSLAVLVTSDCGQTFTQFYLKGGEELATAPDLSSAIFIPTATQWRTDTIDITGFSSQPEVILVFRNLGHFGQALYVDNIRMQTVFPLGINPSPSGKSISVLPNPNNGNFSLRLYNLKKDMCNISILNATGTIIESKKLTPETDNYNQTFNLSSSGKGIYLLKVETEGSVLTKKVVVY